MIKMKSTLVELRKVNKHLKKSFKNRNKKDSELKPVEQHVDNYFVKVPFFFQSFIQIDIW